MLWHRHPRILTKKGIKPKVMPFQDEILKHGTRKFFRWIESHYPDPEWKPASIPSIGSFEAARFIMTTQGGRFVPLLSRFNWAVFRSEPRLSHRIIERLLVPRKDLHPPQEIYEKFCPHSVHTRSYDLSLCAIRPGTRGADLVLWRMAHIAHRNAEICEEAASRGHPLELHKRMIWGCRAGGVERAKIGIERARDWTDGHDECKKVIREFS